MDVKKVAKLANLPLTEGEEEKYSDQLSKILEYIEQLNKVDTANIEPTFNVSGQENVMDKDQIGECLEWEKGLPAGRQGFFVTKGVFTDE